jgi:hypothetical protein
MSTPRSRIVLEEPEHLQATIEAMVRREKLDAFAIALTRLIATMSSYLAEDPGPDRTRTARLWPNYHQENDFFWAVMEEPTDGSAPDEKRIIVGGLHYHDDDGSWRSHT